VLNRSATFGPRSPLNPIGIVGDTQAYQMRVVRIENAILVLTLRNSLIPVNAAYVLFQSRTDACSRDLISLNSRFFSPLNLDAHF
jgi:hypothetical protein